MGSVFYLHLAVPELLQRHNNWVLHSKTHRGTGFSMMNLSGDPCTVTATQHIPQTESGWSALQTQHILMLCCAGAKEKSHWYLIPSKTVAVTTPQQALLRGGNCRVGFREASACCLCIPRVETQGAPIPCQKRTRSGGNESSCTHLPMGEHWLVAQRDSLRRSMDKENCLSRKHEGCPGV